MKHLARRMRLCNGRILSMRWGRYVFGCPKNQRTLVSAALSPHRIRGAHALCRKDGHKMTVRAEAFVKAARR